MLNQVKPEKNSRQEHSKNRQFGLLVGGVLALIAAWLYWQKGSVNLYLLIPSLLLLTMAVWMPTQLTFFRSTWEKIGLLLGTVNSYIILTLIYLFIFVPYGLLLKLLNKDILEKRIHPSAKSYWQKRAEWGKSMKHQF